MPNSLFKEIVDSDGVICLLTSKQVCSRLSISRVTLDRWRRNAGKEPVATRAGPLTQFPKPDVRIGKSSRWKASTLAQWLKQCTEA
jgi:predicted DNA-binding transcriptional regulator AlpA